jgi:S-formylglutathione hydrolase FrmB
MVRALAVVAVCLVMTACAPKPAAPAGPSAAATTTRTSSVPKTTGPKALADGVIPTDCRLVSDAELLSGLAVATTASTVSTPTSVPMPTSEAQATEEDRVWPGLGCLYASPEADQEATILVMPDTSPFFTRRQTTTCLPTYGKGAAVDLGGVSGWYCPTTNETPGEWVSFVHKGRLVTVSRTSAPSGGSPYRNVLVSYASWLAQRL